MMKKIRKISVLVLVVILIINGCKKENIDNPTNGKSTAVFNSSVTYGTMTDQDGNIYKTVTIGTQTWMAENLRATKYNDGTAIPNVMNNNDWVALSIGAYCNYNNTTNLDTIATFGRLYNWYALNTGKLAPKGWHVPTDVEWTTLTSYFGGEQIAGGKLKESGTAHWHNPNIGATNNSGFTALPSGIRFFDGMFGNNGWDGAWWSSTEADSDNAWYRFMNMGFSDVLRDNNNIIRDNSTKSIKILGFSIRCVKD